MAKNKPKKILKNDENITNKPTINFFTKYEGITNKPTRKPYRI
jgi:hypothetical protein